MPIKFICQNKVSKKVHKMITKNMRKKDYDLARAIDQLTLWTLAVTLAVFFILSLLSAFGGAA